MDSGVDGLGTEWRSFDVNMAGVLNNLDTTRSANGINKRWRSETQPVKEVSYSTKGHLHFHQDQDFRFMNSNNLNKVTFESVFVGTATVPDKKF